MKKFGGEIFWGKKDIHAMTYHCSVTYQLQRLQVYDTKLYHTYIIINVQSKR